MKILAIRGSNLASLDGEFSIDFTSASFSQDGLIAITGATGSGKSTVLDALCLALFNRIPRLPSRGSQTLIGRADEDDKQRLASHDVRHILRRGTGEGYAEVDFLGVDQKKYRATWLVRRARKRPDGRFQTSEHLCISLQDKKPLGRTRKEIEDIIVEKLGLSFDQFRRSILLAQGDFASFLKSDAATRSRLLEMITGTEVYGEISRQAHQRANVEITKLDQYRIRLNEYETLDADARAILKDGLKQQEELLSHQQRDVTQWQEQLEQLQQLSQKIEQLKQAKADHVIQQSEWQNTEAIRNELQQLKQLQILRLPLQRFDDAQLALKDVRAQHKPLKQQCEKTQKQLTLIKETLDKQQLIYQAAESTFQHAKPKLHEAYKRDNQLHQAEKERQTLQMQEEESKHQLKALHYSLEANQSALQLSKSDQLTVNRWIEQHQSDAVLASQWQLWESLLDDAINKQVKQQQYQQQQVDLKQELKQTTEQQKTLQKNCDISQQTLATYEQALKELDEQKNQLQLDQCIAEIQSYNTNLIQLKELEKLQQQYCDNQAEQLSIKKDLEQLQNSIHHAKMIQKKSEKQLRESDIRLDEASRKNQRALLATGRSAEELRAQLSEGEPCSVCGSREHPFHIQGDAQLKTFANMQDKRVRELQADHDVLKQQQQQASSEIDFASKQQLKQASHLQVIQQQLNRLLKQWEDLSEIAITEFQANVAIKNTQLQLQSTQEEQQKLIQQRSHISEVRSNKEVFSNKVGQQQQEQQLLAKVLQKLQSENEYLGQQIIELHTSLQQTLHRLSDVMPSINEDNLTVLKTTSLRRVKKYQEHQKEQATLETQITQQQSDIEKQLVELQYVNKNLQAQEKAQQTLQQQINELGQLRQALFVDYAELSTEKIEQNLSADLTESKTLYEALQHKYQALKEALISQQSSLQSLDERETELSHLQQHLKKELVLALQPFASDEASVRKKLNKDVIWIKQQEQSVEQLKQALQTSKIHLQTASQRLRVNLTLLKQCLDKIKLLNIYTDNELAKNEAVCAYHLDNAKQAHSTTQKLTSELQFQLREDTNKRKQTKKLQKDYDKQDTITHTWKVMKELIGSQSGAKFRNFAQSLTLEILISHANQRMHELNRRYALQRVPQTDLELQIIDKEMGDEIRPIHSLSGGESFLVSLALALGLASLSSRKTQIDSLFIDEGFGTLDPQTLDTALSALDSLQSQGKMVCIISHVSAITERVAAQIRVKACGNGKSYIELV